MRKKALTQMESVVLAFLASMLTELNVTWRCWPRLSGVLRVVLP